MGWLFFSPTGFSSRCLSQSREWALGRGVAVVFRRRQDRTVTRGADWVQGVPSPHSSRASRTRPS